MLKPKGQLKLCPESIVLVLVLLNLRESPQIWIKSLRSTVLEVMNFRNWCLGAGRIHYLVCSLLCAILQPIRLIFLSRHRNDYSRDFEIQWSLQIRALIALFVSKSQNLQIRQGALLGSF